MQNHFLNREDLEPKIYFIRGHFVMLDSELAQLYQVETRSINQAVRRNSERFPSDFMFQLSDSEYESLRSQTVILETPGRGKYSKYLPFVFTEQGVSMLSSVLKSKTAIQVNIAIMRTFVKFRELTLKNLDLLEKIEMLEKKYSDHDEKFLAVFSAIRKLIDSHLPPAQKRIKGLSK